MKFLKPNKLFLSLLAGLALAPSFLPAFAEPITMDDGVRVRSGVVGLRSDKIEFRSSGGAAIFTLKVADSLATSRTVTIPDPGAAGNFVMTEGAQTINGVKTFGSTPVLSTAALTANGDTLTIQDLGNANFVQSEGAQTINGVKTFGSTPVLSTAALTANGDTITIQDLGNANIVQSEGAQTINGVKTFGSIPVFPSSHFSRQTAVWQVNGAAGSVLADGTTYIGFLPFGRAGVVKRVNCLCGTAPVGGTNTVKVLEATSSGATMLSAATFDPTTLANNVITSPALTGTAADLTLTATQGVYLEWITGTQTTDAVNCAVAVEYEPDAF